MKTPPSHRPSRRSCNKKSYRQNSFPFNCLAFVAGQRNDELEMFCDVDPEHRRSILDVFGCLRHDQVSLMNPSNQQPALSTFVSCVKCDHENAVDAFRCRKCASHLYISCKHCGHLNVRSSERCEECRTQLHQRGKFKWKQAKARKWIKPVSYALVAISSVLTCMGIIKVSQIDFSRQAEDPIYIQVDPETWERLQSK